MQEDKQFPLKVFTPFRAELAEYKKVNAEITFDYLDPKGNEAARSHIYKLRKAKAAVEKARKAEKEDSLQYGRKVDEEAKAITAEIEEMIDVHQKPLDEIEEKEKQRIADIKEKVESLKLQRGCGLPGQIQSSATLKALLEKYKSQVIDESFGEYQGPAEIIKTNSIEELESAIAAAEKREADQAELQCLRDEKEAKEKADAEEKRKRDEAEAERLRLHEAELEAERKKTREAEEKARKEKEERDRADAEEKIRRDAADQARREAEAEAQKKLDEEREAAAKKAADERAASEARERALILEREKAEKEAADEKERAEKAAVDERRRIADEAEKKRQEDADRERDKQHRDKIHIDIKQAIKDSELLIDMNLADDLIKAVNSGQIPHIKIIY